MKEEFYNYDYDEYPEEEYKERDYKIDEAKEELKGFFTEHKEEVFYLKQTQVINEKKFYHWITAKAINELESIDEVLRSEERTLIGKTRVKFFFNKNLRYYKRKINRNLEIIREYSNPDISVASGRLAEVLFLNGFMKKNFIFRGENINKYKGKRWTETKHNLDFIIEKDDITYGCEVKNKFEYIDRDELDLKVDICEELEVKPLIIMRQSPQSYNWERIIQKGGYAMIFEYKILSLDQKKLVNKIRKYLSLPVDCPRAIPDGIIERFIRWHKKQKIM